MTQRYDTYKDSGAALADQALYDAIVEHRRTYYALKYVDYDKHSRATISFLPSQEVLDDWRTDYSNMHRYFIYSDALDFDSLNFLKSEELLWRKKSRSIIYLFNFKENSKHNKRLQTNKCHTGCYTRWCNV